LVCVDRRMLREAVGHENTKHAMIYTRPDWLDMYTGIFEVPTQPYFMKGKIDLTNLCIGEQDNLHF